MLMPGEGMVAGVRVVGVLVCLRELRELLFSLELTHHLGGGCLKHACL